jgi:hypothetical protein
MTSCTEPGYRWTASRRQQAGGRRQEAASSKQQAASGWQEAAGRRQQAAGGWQEAAGGWQEAGGRRQLAPFAEEMASDIRSGAFLSPPVLREALSCPLPVAGRGTGRVVPSNSAATKHRGSNAATKQTSRRPTPPPGKIGGHLRSLEGARTLRSPLRERRVPSLLSCDGVASAPLASLHGSCLGTTPPRRCWEPPSPYPSRSASLRGRGQDRTSHEAEVGGRRSAVGGGRLAVGGER